jgi:hypothetical protein
VILVQLPYFNAIAPLSESALVGRKATIEADNVITGTITYIEGDIFEVEITNINSLKSGNTVKVVIYSPGGILCFRTTVVGKDKGNIILLIPPNMQRLLIRQRQYPRVEVNGKGIIYSMVNLINNTKIYGPWPELLINNISLGGAGFTSIIPLHVKSQLYIEFILDTNYIFNLEILHCVEMNGAFNCGGMIRNFPREQLNSYHALILKKQIEKRLEYKNNQSEEESIEDP